MRETVHDLGLLALRVGAGGMLLYGHGWRKLTHFSELATSFSDPLHVGSGLSLAMAVFAEVFCAAAVALGLLTRYAAAPIVFMLVVAGFVVHAGDPWARRELAFVYLVPFVAIVLLGGGRFALDRHFVILRRR